MARAQRITARRRCHRHARDEGTSRSVWGSHTVLAAVHRSHVRTRHRVLITPGPWKAEKKQKNRSEEQCVS